MKQSLIFLFIIIISVGGYAQPSKPMSQFPSPMQEQVRLHKRILPQHYTGYNFEIKDLLPKPIHVYVPLRTSKHTVADLLIHFHGNKNIVNYAAEHYRGHLVAVAINLGSGSSVYEHPFLDSTMFFRLLDTVKLAIKEQVHHPIQIRHIIVSGFSAGYGAVRAILNVEDNISNIYGILLLDGLHASYIPEGKTLAEGGKIDSSDYINFLNFSKLALRKNSKKKFLFTHTEIFPGTFVSSTESADYLLKELGIKAYPVLKWGPMGMQQISEAKKNHFEIMGFAGNSAPDHIDHLESLSYFLNHLQKNRQEALSIKK